jgi:hypothetical protein
MKTLVIRSCLEPACSRVLTGALSLLLAVCSAWGQGSIKQYDQVNAWEDNLPPSATYVPVRTNMPFGQSFTPALSEVHFLELYLQRGVGAGAPGPSETFVVALREGGIGGPVLGSTDPVVLLAVVPSGTQFIQDFALPVPVSVTPGHTYVFEVAHQAGGDLFGVAYPDGSFGRNYAGGGVIGQGRLGTRSLWFREGVFIPEPSSAWLLTAGLFALGAVSWWRRRGIDAPG